MVKTEQEVLNLYHSWGSVGGYNQRLLIQEGNL
jgi:hypothetical protein